ncbi:hypothetical protein B9G55_16820 [Saccharibacillus sp. O16]|nr:hypothetical protein B9G55_16820 [Saccharibacillus sp. O16]
MELNHPVWSQLTTAYGEGAEVVELLHRLEPNAADGALRQELFDLLLHQNTIYTATLAAMPYLANLAERTPDDQALLDLYITCGLMKLSREGEAEAPIEQSGEFRRKRQNLLDEETVRSIADGYRSGIARLAALYGKAAQFLTAAAAEGEEDEEKVYLLAAHAAYEGQETLARLLFDFPRGDEYVGACPSCDKDWYIWPREADAQADGEAAGGLIVYGQDPILEGMDDQVPVEVTPSAPSDWRPELRSLEHEARRLDAVRLALDIPFLAGSAQCPKCGEQRSVWEVLTGGSE